MCEYCYCDKDFPDGKLGARLMGYSDPAYILKLDKTYDLFGDKYCIIELVKSKHPKQESHTMYRKVAFIRFCPICGAPL